MVKWAEIVAAATVAFFVWRSINPTRSSGKQYLPGRTRIIDRPEVQEKILNITPYRDYDNLVIRDGRVVGGL